MSYDIHSQTTPAQTRTAQSQVCVSFLDIALQEQSLHLSQFFQYNTNIAPQKLPLLKLMAQSLKNFSPLTHCTGGHKVYTLSNLSRGFVGW